MSRSSFNDERVSEGSDGGRLHYPQSVEAVPRERAEPFASRRLDLPRTRERQTVEVSGRVVTVNERESRLLVTVGALRLVPTDDLPDLDRDSRHDALRHLKAQGLLSEQSFTDRTGVHQVLSLTEDGKAFLDSGRASTSEKAQTFYQESSSRARSRMTRACMASSSTRPSGSNAKARASAGSPSITS
jgi:hypothetical protein